MSRPAEHSRSFSLTLVGLGGTCVMLLLACCAAATFSLLGMLPAGGEDSWVHYSRGGMFSSDSPSLSDDADQVVFATPATGHGDIYLADIQTGVARRLTRSDDFESSPHFLPGSRQVVFQREQPPYRHIWLLDLQTGQERQLTSGKVLDEINYVSPLRGQIIVGRSTNWGGGRNLETHLLDVQTGTIRQLGVNSAVFMDDGKALLASDQGEQPAILKMTLQGKASQRLSAGWVTDVCDPAGLALYLRSGKPGDSPNDELYCFDLRSDKSHHIGRGHSATAFADGKVLYFVDYEHRAMIWEQDAKPRQIDSPAGYKCFPNRSPDAKSAALFIMPPNQPDRLYDTYLFDSLTETFAPLNVTLAADEPTP